MILGTAIAGAAVVLVLLWRMLQPEGPGPGFASGNGRIEATEIDVSAKLGGRIDEILVREGAFVEAGQPLVRMQTSTLEAQRQEAMAMRRQAIASVATAKAQVAMRESELAAARANIVEAESALDAAERRLVRAEELARERAMPQQELDDIRAQVRASRAAVAAARAQAVAAESAISAARTQVEGSEYAVEAVAATVGRVEADIRDSILFSPRPGRVQYLIAQPGEVVSPGAPVLNVVDLGDVYMTFFLPETVVGRVGLGTEARIVLDAVPEYVIPAEISFVADIAQFTPRTVETREERQKLMFRVRARIDRELLQRYLTQVKTGLPGVAWVKLDPGTPWPDNLVARVPQ